MERLIIPCPPALIPAKQHHPSEFSPTPLAGKAHRRRVSDAELRNLCNNGRLSEAISAIDLISQSGSKVRYDIYNDLLDACIFSGSVHLGRQLHARIGAVKGVDPFVETKLVGMYAKCGSLEDARKVFAQMRERNLFTWSAMIGACTRDSRWKEAVQLFYSMMGDGVLPDRFLLPKILQACGNCCDLETGRLIHSLVIRKGLSSMRVNNSILSMYAKCGQLSFARKIFNKDERNTVSWNAMISGYFQMNDIEEARRLFDAMLGEGTAPGLITWNILVANYSQLGYCDVALELMNEMKSFGITADVFTWTSMISGFAQNDRTYQALDLFKQMLELGVKPNGVTLASAVSACATLESLRMGLELHSLVFKLGFIHDALVGNSLIDMFSKCRELEAARWVFDNMVSGKDSYTWNSMIAGYCQAGYCGKAYELFTKMQESNVSPNVITWNSMISGYMQNGDGDEAMILFQTMEKGGKIKRNTASWNALIAGYVQNGEKNMALHIFRQMLSFGENLNTVTVLSVLPACENLIAAKKVKEIHGCVLRRNLESELSVANSLIDKYAKSGNMVYSRTIFDQMSAKDNITWNTLIAGYVLHGCSDTALYLFDRMRKLGVKRNRGTFISIVSAYARAGMVEEGKQTFSSITEEYLIAPAMEHYVAMIDLYGRSGRLGEAMEFLKSMPIDPDSSVWAALLTACRIHGNFALAMHAAEQLHELEPDNFVIHWLVSQLYALSGRSQDAPRLRVNVTKRPVGQSWIEVRNTVHSFITGDSSQPYSHFLHSWLETIAGKMEMHNNQYGFSMEEEEEEETGGVHSEKLAIAFGLVSSTQAPRSIRIVKNLRMCEDCHRTAKYISLTHGCEIYLGDPGCFHHFKSGHCSCGDYW